MEEILSSIKRIIAEEEGAPPRRRPAARPASAAFDDEPAEPEAGQADDTILELSQPLAAEESAVRPAASRPFVPPSLASPTPAASQMGLSAAPAPLAASAPAPAPAASVEASSSASASADPPADPIVSPKAADATRGSLESLSRMIVRPSVSGGEETLEGLVRELLKPMLRDWLDARLPEIVETMVAREIARISGRDA